MIVVIDQDGYFVSKLHDVDELNASRPDVVEAPEMEGLNTLWRLVDGAWVPPEPVAVDPGGIARPPRS